MSVVAINNLSKHYEKGSIKALKGIDLQVEEGELFGLIGPDGAGKTSLLRLLATLLLPDGGSAKVLGMDIVKDYLQIRPQLGYMPGKFSLYQDLTVEENVDFFATLFQTSLSANYDLIKPIYLQLEPFKKRPAGKLSGGMKQKLALCCALIHKPKLLLLDEPTTGVDAVSRKEFWDMLSNLHSQGISILVSTPYMDEAIRCTRVALMQEGKILSTNPPQQIINAYTRPLVAVRGQNIPELLQSLRNLEPVHSAYAFGDSIHVAGKEKEGITGKQFAHRLLGLSSGISDIEPITAGIEDCFIELMQNEE